MTTQFFHPTTIAIVKHASEHNRVRAELGLPPRVHGRRAVRDTVGVTYDAKRESDNSAETR